MTKSLIPAANQHSISSSSRDYFIFYYNTGDGKCIVFFSNTARPAYCQKNSLDI